MQGTSEPAPGSRSVVARFVRTEAAGGLVLVVAAGVALVWANSQWQESYRSLWDTSVALHIGPFQIDEDLRELVNDGLMAVFFLVVGLEVKRELVRGELAERRVAALPAVAALGGMAVPAVVYLAVAGGGPGGDGWGIPMATDIAFALAVLSLLGPRVPARLKILLLTLAIVDDIGAIVVIAVFYSKDIDAIALCAAIVGMAIVGALWRARVEQPIVYVGLGLTIWYFTYRSGVHATIAGVALGLATPATAANGRASPAERLEERLNPFASFVILPLFALANSGIEFRSGMLDHPGTGAVAAGVFLGLVAGKFVGILLGSWVGLRTRIATLPEGVGWPHLAGLAALGGIGFTVSLFITGLAFTGPELSDAAKLAIIAASVTSSVTGTALLLRTRS